jgi:hypothetical protein
LNTLVISIALGSTIIGSLAFGIGLGYFAIVGILNALSRNRAVEKPAAAALASTAGGSSGR